MGKSSKKIKSDRINAIRKRYDAFLEEDKKRKERNEYILGRLDNMRFSTTMLPLRRKQNIIPDRNATIYRIGCQPEKGMLHDYQLSCLNPTQITSDVPIRMEERALIQEISKKYILIPKLRQTFTDSCIQDAPTLNAEPFIEDNIKREIKVSDGDSIDWKSKYEILNILKEEEKAESPIQFKPATSLLNEQSKLVLNDNNMEAINDDADNSEKGRKYVNELPEKVLDKICSKEYGQNNKCYDPSTNVNHTSDIPLKNPISEIDYKLQHTNLEYNPAVVGNDHSVEFVKYEQNIEMQPEYDVNKTSANSGHQNIENEHLSADKAYSPKAEISNDFSVQNKDAPSIEILDDIAPIQIISPDDFVKEEVIRPLPSVEPESNIENIVYPIDIINAQNFTPDEDIQPKDGISINPEEHAIQQDQIMSSNKEITQLAADTEQPQNPIDTSGIEEFETEQQNMFYSDQTGENYAYQGGAGEVYNSEYEQNEPYQQNEEYTYYEGTQPEVYQPIEINEHQETSQHYDQNYEQQYVNSYEQEHEQKSYEQGEQEYKESEVYPTQPEVEQLHYQQQNEETLEEVQKVLDGEQGYTDVQNTLEANEAEKTVPLQQQQTESIGTSN